MRKEMKIAALFLACCLVSVSGWAEGGSDLISQLTQKLSITPQQATGGAGALFRLAKGRLKPEEFSRVAAVVPGMDGLLAAAPKPAEAVPPTKLAEGSAPLKTEKTVVGGTSALGAATPPASLADSFKSLGLSPDMVGKFVPILTQFVGAKGGFGTASLLVGALK